MPTASPELWCGDSPLQYHVLAGQLGRAEQAKAAPVAVHAVVDDRRRNLADALGHARRDLAGIARPTQQDRLAAVGRRHEQHGGGG